MWNICYICHLIYRILKNNALKSENDIKIIQILWLPANNNLSVFFLTKVLPLLLKLLHWNLCSSMEQSLELAFSYRIFCLQSVYNKHSFNKRKKEKKANPRRKGCLAQDRDSALFVHHQGEFMNKHGFKTPENVIQVFENEQSCGNILNADISGAVSWVFSRRGSNLKEEARPFLTANTQSETTAKIPQTFLQSMSSDAFWLFFPPVCTLHVMLFVVALVVVIFFFFPQSWAIQLVIWFSSEHFVVRFPWQLDVNSCGSILKISHLN